MRMFLRDKTKGPVRLGGNVFYICVPSEVC